MPQTSSTTRPLLSYFTLRTAFTKYRLAYDRVVARILAHKREDSRISRIPGSSTSRRSTSDWALRQLSRHHPIRHAGLRSRPYLDSQHPGAYDAAWRTSRNERTRHANRRHHLPTEVRSPRGVHRRPDGRLYMNAADYYHGLPGEQGDPLEASLAYGVGVYAHWPLPIYCMFTVRESDIVDNAVVITKRMVEEFRCSDGWIGIVRYDRFERLLNWDIDSGDDISLHGSVLYGAPTPPQHSPESSLMLTGVPVK